ncbi:hypothetical protein JT358_11690 [Micrococcales bacterium 31B]|nr:hypothetical protein [Micrococcales bacterium 31B]
MSFRDFRLTENIAHLPTGGVAAVLVWFEGGRPNDDVEREVQVSWLDPPTRLSKRRVQRIDPMDYNDYLRIL